MEEQKEKEIIFSKLLSQIITIASNDFSLEQVKDYFAAKINSPRALNKVNSLGEIFHLLKQRDLLSWKRVVPLQCLGELLGNEHIKDIVRCYKKMWLDEGTNGQACEICCVPLVLNLGTVPLNEHHGNRDGVINTRNISMDSLNVALENVALSIGGNWGVLVRELGLKEIQIDKCVETHPKDYVAQARMALKLWRQMEKENASIEKLDRALNARYCKIKGIGVHLKSPIYGVNC